MPVSVRTGADGRVARAGFGVCVIVVTVSEPRALFHKQVEAAALELGLIAVQVVSSELIDDHDDDKLWFANICLRRSRR